MKSQDILLALKLICLFTTEKQIIKIEEYHDFINENPETILVEETPELFSNVRSEPYLDESDNIIHNHEENWKGWHDNEPLSQFDINNSSESLNNFKGNYTARGLASLTGISKTEVAKSLNRSINTGLVYQDRKDKTPRTNKTILYNFIIHGLKYVFPANLSTMTRGIPTSFASPVLSNHIKSAGNLIYIWPDPEGTEIGQAVDPLFQSVPYAVRRDRQLYEYLALIDAIRLGNAREVNLAKSQLEIGLLS